LDSLMTLTLHFVRHSARGLALAAGCLLLASCALAGHPAKRARMATALPSPTVTPLSAPFRSTGILPSSPAGTSVPATTPGCAGSAGTVKPETLATTVSGQMLGYFVYLPPCYESDSQARYPVLLLFHGLGRTPEQWLDLGLVQTADRLILAGQIPPLLIVLPYVTGEDSDDAVILADLLPAVDGAYRTRPDRSHRAAGGISRGAEWALRLALRRADLFGAVGMHSLSPAANAMVDIYSWAEAVPAELWPRIYLDAGYSDPQLPQMMQILQLFDLLKRPYEKHIPPGDHSDGYWSAHLEEYLLWYSQGWK
jgi:enterochelin esterase-like enzyme